MSKEQKQKLYDENKNKATDKLGVCPVCKSKNNKIFFGRPGCQDLCCENGHIWNEMDGLIAESEE